MDAIAKSTSSSSDEFEVEMKKRDGNKREPHLKKIPSLRGSATVKEDDKNDIGRKFQNAVSLHDWDGAEDLIGLADGHRLNDGLCVALDSLWFLSSEEELNRAVNLIENLIRAGAHDFTRATLRTSFLVSCVSACRSHSMGLADTVTVMAQRLRERLKESNEDEEMKADAASKVQRFTDWALKCIGSHSAKGEGSSHVLEGSIMALRLQLKAFRKFLYLAGNNLTVKDMTEAFDAACFPLTLFSNAIDPGWATSVAATAMRGLLELLIEAGADNVNQCFLEAARFGSTELVRILLQIGRRSNIELDADLALGFASHYSKLSTMECLVDEGGAEAFLGPLMRASERGSLPIVQWFVERGCKDMELCLALTAAAASCQLDTAEYLLARVPRYVLQALGIEVIKAAGERSGGSLAGISFLLQSDFLNNVEATYRLADTISKSDDESIPLELKAFLFQEWSEEAFVRGRILGDMHHVNVMRVLKRGNSPLRLDELPMQLQVAISYVSLYKECTAAKGAILSQLLRGQLVEAAVKLTAGKVGRSESVLLQLNKQDLLKILASRFPSFLISKSDLQLDLFKT